MIETAEIKQFQRVLAELRERFPGLIIRATTEADEPVDAFASIPPQQGLDFGFHFTLQGDELHLHVGGSFWVEWFPCDDGAVTDEFIEAVSGIISGRYRIVEHIIAEAPVKAQLQQPREDGGWRNVATWSSLAALIPWRRTRAIIQNTGAGPVTASRGA
jgi:hypothetical protein